MPSTRAGRRCSPDFGQRRARRGNGGRIGVDSQCGDSAAAGGGWRQFGEVVTSHDYRDKVKQRVEAEQTTRPANAHISTCGSCGTGGGGADHMDLHGHRYGAPTPQHDLLLRRQLQSDGDNTMRGRSWVDRLTALPILALPSLAEAFLEDCRFSVSKSSLTPWTWTCSAAAWSYLRCQWSLSYALGCCCSYMVHWPFQQHNLQFYIISFSRVYSMT
jgi:hypothetical protein